MARKQGTFTSRTKARKRAADVIFEAEQRGMTANPNDLADLLEERKIVTAAQTPLPPYSIEIIAGVASQLKTIDKYIDTRAKIEELDRLPGVDLAVMRVAVWEMLANSLEVDPIIAIDEAVAIVKSISTDKSPSFVNAVLDSIRVDLQKDGRNKKAKDTSPVDNRPIPADHEPATEQTDSEAWEILLDEY